nr:4'-phosphopantetheinyl transferase superfamily protein [Microbulbifer rhizosphaerae]
MFELFGVDCPEWLKDSAAGRKSEFLAGRIAAKTGFSRLVGERPDFSSVLSSSVKNRCPQWKPGFVGSISHTSDRAFCAVGSKRGLRYVGVDMEDWIGNEVIRNIERKIIDRHERTVMEESGAAYEKVFTAVFSAKESLFKALYPLVGRYFGFEIAKVTSVDLGRGILMLQLEEGLHHCFPRGMELAAEVYFQAGYVITIVWAGNQLSALVPDFLASKG